MVRRRRNRLWVALGIAILAGAVPAIAADLVLVRGGSPKAVIVVPDNASDALREVAADMSQTIEAMSGAALRVVSETDGPAIFLGSVDESLEPLAYRVRRDGDRLVITGGSEQGVINGAYAFLEQELGVRWYLPGPLGTYIPKRATVKISDVDFGDAPDYKSVRGFGGHPDREQSRLWMLRNRMTGFPAQNHGHNWRSILNPDLRDDHPEWFALQENGERSDQLCTTNPTVIDCTIAVVNRFFDRYPDYPMYSMSPNDNDDFCRCDRCRALDTELGVDPLAPQGSYTDRIVYYLNQVAEGVKPKHPDKQLAFYAYINHTEPPKVVKPDPMLLPVACHTPWDYCQNHAINDPECQRNAAFADVIRGWSELSPELYVYDYYGAFAWFGPMGIVHTIRRDLPWLHENGVTGFNSETHDNWWTQGLNWYVALKLYWDLDTDVDRIVSEWHRDLYGPAAPQMAEYWQRYEDAAQNTPYDGDAERGWVIAMTPEFFQTNARLLDDAEAAVNSSALSADEKETILLRLRKVRMGERISRAQAPAERYKANNGDLYSVLASNEDPAELLAEIESDPFYADVMDPNLGRGGLLGGAGAMKNVLQVWKDTNLSDEERAELVQMLADGRDTDVADSLGFITHWKIAGIFYPPGTSGIMHPFPPEDDLDFDTHYDTPQGEVVWTDYTVDNAYGVINFRDMFPGRDITNAVVYAYGEIEYYGRKARGKLRVGSNDGVAIWHNGVRVMMSDVARDVPPDYDRVMVPLSRGKNTFLVKVFNTQNNFWVAVRVLNDSYRHADEPRTQD